MLPFCEQQVAVPRKMLAKPTEQHRRQRGKRIPLGLQPGCQLHCAWEALPNTLALIAALRQPVSKPVYMWSNWPSIVPRLRRPAREIRGEHTVSSFISYDERGH
jgi:hypothetical protein